MNLETSFLIGVVTGAVAMALVVVVVEYIGAL